MSIVSLSTSYNNNMKDTLIDLGDIVLRNNQGSVCYIKNLKNNLNNVTEGNIIYSDIDGIENCVDLIGTKFVLVSDSKYVFEYVIENNYDLNMYFFFKNDDDVLTAYHKLLDNNIETKIHLILDIRKISLTAINKLIALQNNKIADFKICAVTDNLRKVPEEIKCVILLNNNNLVYNSLNIAYIKNEQFPAYKILVGQSLRDVIHYIDEDNTKINIIDNNIFIVNFIHYLGGLDNNEKDINL